MRTNVQVVLALVASAGLISVVHAQSKVELEYKPQKPNGSLGGAVQFKYDMSPKSATRTSEPGSKGAGSGQGQAGFGYGSAGAKADGGAGSKGRAAVEAAAYGKGVAADASGGKAGGSAAAKVDLEYKPQKPDGSPYIGPSKAAAAAKFQDDAPEKPAARTAAQGSKAPGGSAGQAGFGYGSSSKDEPGGGAQARQTPRTDFGSQMGQGISRVPDVAKTPTPGGPVPIPYPNTPIDVKPPVVRAPLPILLPIETPRPIVTPTLPIIAQPVPVAPKPVIVEPVPQPAIKVPYSAPVNRR